MEALLRLLDDDRLHAGSIGNAILRLRMLSLRQHLDMQIRAIKVFRNDHAVLATIFLAGKADRLKLGSELDIVDFANLGGRRVLARIAAETEIDSRSSYTRILSRNAPTPILGKLRAITVGVLVDHRNIDAHALADEVGREIPDALAFAKQAKQTLQGFLGRN